MRKRRQGGPKEYKKGKWGRKIRSRGKGKGLGRGKGKGPMGVPTTQTASSGRSSTHYRTS